MTSRATKSTQQPQPVLYDGVEGSYEDRDSELLCPVCLDLITEAYVTVCGHSFCHSCIVKSFEVSNKCPKCNLPFDSRQSIFPNVTLNTLIAKKRKAQRSEYDDKEKRPSLLKDFSAILNRNLCPSEVNYMLQVLHDKQVSLDSQRKLSEIKLLHEFLLQLKIKKTNELKNIEKELNLLERDLVMVQSQLDVKEISEINVTNEMNEAKSAKEEGVKPASCAFNASTRVNSLNFSQRRVRMHSHLDDLEKKYWSEDNLSEFQSNLNHLTRYNSLRPLANLSYGNDLLNTAHIVSSIEFDKDSDFFAIAGVTKRIKVYDYNSVVRDVVDMHYPVMEMVASSKISCVAWSSYHKSVLCSSDYEGNVSVWDSSVGTRLRVFQEHEKRCWSVDFNRVDSHLMASGSDDSRVKIWSLNSEHSVATLEAKANVCCVKFNPHSRYHLAYGAADHCVHYVDLRQPKEPVRIFKGHRKAVSYVKFINDKELVSASTDSQLKLWTTEENASVRSFKGHTNEKNFVGLSNNEELIACGSENNALYVYYKGLSGPLFDYKFDVVKSALEKERAEEESVEFISAVCWKPNSNVIVAANSQGTIKLLEID